MAKKPKAFRDGQLNKKWKQGYRRYRKASPVTIIKPDGTVETQDPYDVVDLYRVTSGKKPRRKSRSDRT